MAALTPASAQAIARLRAYVPPATHWHALPLTRRAAVLLLLYPDRKGDLRVVLTLRASTLKNYAGHAALPGGKADDLAETPWQVARREAYEEIGLPQSDAKLPPPFKVEHLCELPANLARTELGVRPCVAFLHAVPDGKSGAKQVIPDVEETFMPRLDAKEVAAVFTAPFHNFLRAEDEQSASADPEAGVEAAGFPADWYKGEWTDWHESKWRMHNFYVPVKDQRVTKAEPGKSQEPGLPYGDRQKARQAMDDLDQLSRYRVFGMTARILVDCARVAYDEKPAFEHNANFGDEEMIERLMRMGRLGAIRKKGDQLTRDVMTQAAKL